MKVFIELEKTLRIHESGVARFEQALQQHLQQFHPLGVQRKVTCFLGPLCPHQVQGAVVVNGGAWFIRKHALQDLAGFRVSAELKEPIGPDILARALRTGQWPPSLLLNPEQLQIAGIMQQERKRYLYQTGHWAVDISLDEVTWAGARHHFIEFDVPQHQASHLQHIHAEIMAMVEDHPTEPIATSKLFHILNPGG